MLDNIDFSALGTAVAVLAKSNPVAAIATGIITGIFGNAFFGNKKKKELEADLEEKNKLLDILLTKAGEKKHDDNN